MCVCECTALLCPASSHLTLAVSWASWVNNIMLGLFIQQGIDPPPCVYLCVCVSVGVSEDKQADGTRPKKGGTFWKSKFDIKSNQFLRPSPRLTV